MNPFCIYHGNCADGFGAAWVVRSYFKGEVDFYAGFYGQEPPDVTGRDVILVDFSYKRAVLDKIAGVANTVLILDHHKTAAEDLDGYPSPEGPYDPRALLWYEFGSNALPRNVRALFDMHRSGATLAWDYFFPGLPRPELLNHIEDRDLWLFKLEGTREIQASVFSYPYDFDAWDDLMLRGCQDLRAEGVAIERKHHKDVGELVAASIRRMKIGGHDVPVANLPYTLSSDAGHLMARGEPFAACYMDTPRGRVFSLRSTDAGEDVSAIAKAYGGGGHRNASGFQMPIGWEGDATDSGDGR